MILAFGYLIRSGNPKFDVWWYAIAAILFVGWLSSWRMDRRLDAVVQLLLNERAHLDAALTRR